MTLTPYQQDQVLQSFILYENGRKLDALKLYCEAINKPIGSKRSGEFISEYTKFISI